MTIQFRGKMLKYFKQCCSKTHDAEETEAYKLSVKLETDEEEKFLTEKTDLEKELKLDYQTEVPKKYARIYPSLSLLSLLPLPDYNQNICDTYRKSSSIEIKNFHRSSSVMSGLSMDVNVETFNRFYFTKYLTEDIVQRIIDDIIEDALTSVNLVVA